MKPEIIEVRSDNKQGPFSSDGTSLDLRDQIIQGLSKPSGEKTLPAVVLYDEQGLQLYDAITTDVPEYYLFAAEEEILKNNSDDIVCLMKSRTREAGCYNRPVVLELGAGALRKTIHILLALPRTDEDKDISSASEVGYVYYALDLEKRELERTLSDLMDTYGDKLKGKVEAKGLCGTYDDGLVFVRNGGIQLRPQTGGPYVGNGSDTGINATSPLHILFLGSSLGNFHREQATSFLRELPLRPGAGDTLLLGLDHINGKEKIELAYNDPAKISERFVMNGLKGAGRIIGDEQLFEKNKWEYFDFYNEAERRHEAYYKAKEDQNIRIPGSKNSISFRAGELVNVAVSLKYSDEDAYSMFTESDLRPIKRWTDSAGQYSLWLLERPAFTSKSTGKNRGEYP